MKSDGKSTCCHTAAAMDKNVKNFQSKRHCILINYTTQGRGGRTKNASRSNTKRPAMESHCGESQLTFKFAAKWVQRINQNALPTLGWWSHLRIPYRRTNYFKSQNDDEHQLTGQMMNYTEWNVKIWWPFTHSNERCAKVWQTHAK